MADITGEDIHDLHIMTPIIAVLCVDNYDLSFRFF